MATTTATRVLGGHLRHQHRRPQRLLNLAGRHKSSEKIRSEYKRRLCYLAWRIQIHISWDRRVVDRLLVRVQHSLTIAFQLCLYTNELINRGFQAQDPGIRQAMLGFQSRRFLAHSGRTAAHVQLA